jgi:hypothetical protein
MKLNDCGCGGSPQVVYTFDPHIQFAVSCPVCGNTTPDFKDLKEAVKKWNTCCWKIQRCAVE